MTMSKSAYNDMLIIGYLNELKAIRERSDASLAKRTERENSLTEDQKTVIDGVRKAYNLNLSVETQLNIDISHAYDAIMRMATVTNDTLARAFADYEDDFLDGKHRDADHHNTAWSWMKQCSSMSLEKPSEDEITLFQPPTAFEFKILESGLTDNLTSELKSIVTKGGDEEEEEETEVVGEEPAKKKKSKPKKKEYVEESYPKEHDIDKDDTFSLDIEIKPEVPFVSAFDYIFRAVDVAVSPIERLYNTSMQHKDKRKDETRPNSENDSENNN